MKRFMKVFGVVTLLGSMAGGVYYFLFMRSRKPQVELYFDDGSMLAMPGSAPEAQPFVDLAEDILAAQPLAQ